MDLPQLGHVVIINNIQAEVAGFASDVQTLQQTYETVGFDIQVHTDCSNKVGECVFVVFETKNDMCSLQEG